MTTDQVKQPARELAERLELTEHPMKVLYIEEAIRSAKIATLREFLDRASRTTDPHVDVATEFSRELYRGSSNADPK